MAARAPAKAPVRRAGNTAARVRATAPTGAAATISAARMENFKTLAEMAGGPTVLAGLVKGSKSYFARLKQSPNAQIGPVAARAIERGLDLEPHWMDLPHADVAEVVREVGPKLDSKRSEKKRPATAAAGKRKAAGAAKPRKTKR